MVRDRGDLFPPEVYIRIHRRPALSYCTRFEATEQMSTSHDTHSHDSFSNTTEHVRETEPRGPDDLTRFQQLLTAATATQPVTLSNRIRRSDRLRLSEQLATSKQSRLKCAMSTAVSGSEESVMYDLLSRHLEDLLAESGRVAELMGEADLNEAEASYLFRGVIADEKVFQKVWKVAFAPPLVWVIQE